MAVVVFRTTFLLLALAISALAAELPRDWVLKGECETSGEKLTARQPATLTIPTKPNESVEITLSLGRIDSPLVLRATDAGKGAVELTLLAKDFPKSPWPWVKGIVKDAGLTVALRKAGEPWLFNDSYWIRPNPHFYHGADLKRALDNWDKLTSASQHPLRLRMDVESGAIAFWLDDRFLGRADLRTEKITLSLKPEASLFAGRTSRLDQNPRYVAVRLGGYQRAGAFGGAKISLEPGRKSLSDVPFEIAAPGDSIDVGVSRWLEEATGPDDFTDDYCTRSAFDGTPESLLLAVPTGDYSHAHLLCAVDPDPAKTPVLSLRLTRLLKDYLDSGGRGDAFADTSIRLEQANGRWPEGVREVGQADLDTPAGKKRVPLLQVRVPLRSGSIQDVLDERGIYIGRSTQYLDLELTRELHQATRLNHANYSIKPLGKPSGVRVFGLTLERSPLRIRLVQKQVGNVFYAAEKPELALSLNNVSADRFEGEVACEIKDFYGASRAVTQKIALEPGKSEEVRLDVGGGKLGWFGAVVQVKTRGEVLWEVPTSFAILPSDTRKAGQESPFGVWWFRDIHVGTKSIDEIAPLLQRLGFRHVCPGGSGPSGEELAKYGLSISMLPNLIGAKDPEKAIDAAVKAHPDAKWALIFHENGFGEPLVFPPEFIGQPVPKLNEQQEKAFKALWDKAVAVSQIYRRKYPQIKLILGNGSLAFAVEFMRRGYPRELVDAFGDEDLGQLLMPEMPPMAFKSIYWFLQYARLYHYDVPITACYEWRGRPTTPGCLTQREQAELYARDALQALAFRLPNISLGLLHDTGDAYFYSRWGGTGLCHRWPLLNPKPSYVALATLTRELDGAKFTRYLASNSPSLYIAEFERGDEKVYALWLPRGDREVALTFDRDARFVHTDMLGNPTESATSKQEVGRANLHAEFGATLRVSSSPSYLRVAAKIAKAAAGPTVCEPAPEKRRVVDDLCDRSRWDVVAEPDAFLDKTHFDFPRRLGKFDIAVKDDDPISPLVPTLRVGTADRTLPRPPQGKALEVKLLPQPDVPAPCSRYLILKARDPQPIEGRPTAVGIWVKGNSSWGRINWEFEDAKGERFFSISAGEGEWLVGDWKTRTYINFDGWNYLQVRLPTWHESGFYGPERCDWKTTGGDGRVDFPIKLTRLVIELRDRVVHLTDLLPVPDPAIRLKDLSVSFH